MKSIILSLAISSTVFALPPDYRAKGWVWVDSQDKEGKWHLGAQDKRGHFIAGMIVGSWTHLYWEKQGWKYPRLAAFIASLLVGYAKEWHDLRNGSGTAEHADALMTTMGGVCGAELVRFRW